MEKLKQAGLAYTEARCAKNLTATEDALYVLGGKWTLRIVIAVLSGHHRFNDLQRTVNGISARVLSSELKDLELNGLVRRVVLADQKPVVTEYLPTEYTRTLRTVIDALAEWGEKHKRRIFKRE
ncbi:MAG: helix-turn-helix transcriptional regulator [Bacteroidetes bacterium]|nr:helix-turn-helix transcriptional regulator [Bacteroidota bacterium]